MSKVIAGTAFVLLGGATAAGGVLLSRNSGKGQPDIELPTTLTELSKNAHSKGCVPTLLTGLTDVSGTADDVGTSDITETSLTDSGKKKNTAGCLVVNWDRKTKKNGAAVEKWSGTIRFLWAAKGDSKGFLVLLVGTTSNATDKKIAWTGTAYTLAKESDVWRTKKKQSVGNDKSFSKSSEDNQFPQPGEALGDIKNKTFWGFMGSKDEAEKVDNSATDLTEDGTYRGHWDWVGSEGTDDKALDGWTKELCKWWDAIFTKTNWDMTKVVKDSKATWTLKSETPSSTTAK